MHAVARLPVLVVAFVVSLASLAGPLAVSAQDEAADPTAVPPSVTTGADQTADDTQEAGQDENQESLVTNDATAIQLEPAMALVIVLVLLLVALFALMEIFRYLNEGRRDYYKTFQEFARKGVYLTPVMVGATAVKAPPERIDANGAVTESAQPAETFVMTGPGVLVTGEQGTFTALLNNNPATETRWKLTTPDGADVPPQSATLEPKTGASATFMGVKAGVYHLMATPPGFPEPPPTTINVVDPPPAGADVPALPFIGEGYGSIVGAILLLAVIVVLAATRAIDADVVGVLLGSLAGYLFGVGVAKGAS